MENFSDNDLRQELTKRGYYTTNLWRVDDVKEIFSVTDEQAIKILHNSLTNDETMNQVWLSINTFGDMEGHRRVDKFKVGDIVEVPEPETDDDIHNHSFVGNIIKIKGIYAIVEDGDGDCFDIELDRLTHEE